MANTQSASHFSGFRSPGRSNDSITKILLLFGLIYRWISRVCTRRSSKSLQTVHNGIEASRHPSDMRTRTPCRTFVIKESKVGGNQHRARSDAFGHILRQRIHVRNHVSEGLVVQAKRELKRLFVPTASYLALLKESRGNTEIERLASRLCEQKLYCAHRNFSPSVSSVLHRRNAHIESDTCGGERGDCRPGRPIDAQRETPRKFPNHCGISPMRDCKFSHKGLRPSRIPKCGRTNSCGVHH